MSRILGKKPNPKQNWKHPTHKNPMFLQVASLPVSLLEFLCAVVSNCHRFCSLHERGRSRQLRLRKPCPAISFPKVPQVLCKKDHLIQGENPLFKILRIWRSAHMHPPTSVPSLLITLRKHFLQLSFCIWIRPLTFAAEAKGKVCTGLWNFCTGPLTACIELVLKGTCNTTSEWQWESDACLGCRGAAQQPSPARAANTSLDACTQRTLARHRYSSEVQVHRHIGLE